MRFLTSGDAFTINIDSEHSYTYTASSGDGSNEVISGLIGLIGTELDGEYTITTTEDSAGLSNFIVSSDDLNNDFNFSASFSDYLQGTSTDTYLLEHRNFFNNDTIRLFNFPNRYCS